MKLNKEHVRNILNDFGALDIYDDDRGLSYLADTLNQRFGDPILPVFNESLVVTLLNRKTAALAFDRVYRIPVLDDPVPEEVGFYCGTPSEVIFTAQIFLLQALDQTDSPYKLKETVRRFRAGENKELRGLGEKRSLKVLCSDFKKHYGFTPTILYSEPSARNKDFQNGAFEILTSSISNIAMVDESELSWEQVIEFRKDVETRAKYRRFVRWIDIELKSKSPKEAEDLIAVRLDDYKWAIKKHGLKTSIGTLSCLLDPKFLAGASAAIAATSVAGGNIWGALAGASLIFGRAVVNFGTAKIDELDERRKENYEVAYVHEIQKNSGKANSFLIKHYFNCQNSCFNWSQIQSFFFPMFK